MICNQNEVKWIESIHKCFRGYFSYIIENLYFYPLLGREFLQSALVNYTGNIKLIL